MIRKLYPNGMRKAFNVTYDDGVEQDVRFVALLNRYGLKGTFNLNSALMENGFAWTHESGRVIRRLRPEIARSLYAGHEIASHTLTHPYMDHLDREAILWELREDKAKLETLFGRAVEGFAVPFDYYSDLIAECVKECGFSYARISREHGAFTPQKAYYHWCATVFHCSDAMEKLVADFLQTREELALLQIVGHSYDLDVENKWECMEVVFAAISRQPDILPMTTGELIAYLRAMDMAEIGEGYIQNHSALPLWFAVEGALWRLEPGQRRETV